MPTLTDDGRHAMGTFPAAGTLAVMILLAFLFVDATGRGRYTWPVRIGAAAAFLAVCAML